MKKVLSVLAVLAVAAGFAFADDAAAAANFENTFKLKTTVKAQPHVFFLGTDSGSALAADAVVDENVDLTKDGTYDRVKLYLAADGNQTTSKSYTVSVKDTDFVGEDNHDMKVATDLALSVTDITVPAGKTSVTEREPLAVQSVRITVPAGKTSVTEESTVTVSWKGVPALAADTYIDTITVTVASND